MAQRHEIKCTKRSKTSVVPRHDRTSGRARSPRRRLRALSSSEYRRGSGNISSGRFAAVCSMAFAAQPRNGHFAHVRSARHRHLQGVAAALSHAMTHPKSGKTTVVAGVSCPGTMLPQEKKQVDAEYVHGLRLVTIQRNTCQGPAARPLDPPANARSTLRHTSRLCSMCVIWFRSRIDSSHSLATLRVSIPATRPLRPAPYFVTKLVPSFASRSRSPSMQESPQTKQAMLASSVCFLQPRHDECKHSRTRKTSRCDNEPHAVLPLSR